MENLATTHGEGDDSLPAVQIGLITTIQPSRV